MLVIRSAYGKFLHFIAIMAGLVTFAMMWLIVANALSRKILNAPVPAGLEISQSLLTVAIMLPFGYVLLRREHVNTVFLTSRLPKAVDHWLQFFWMIVGGLVFAAVTYGTFKFAQRSYVMNEQVWGAAFRFPVYPAKFAVSFGAALLSIQFFIDALLTLVGFDDGELSAAVGDHERSHHHV